MTTNTPPPNGPSGGPQTEPEAGRWRSEQVILLEGLLRELFADPQSLEFITIDDVVRRYPLTGLGAPALAAIEQSRRIVRARGDYGQAGLGEFHVGLIYMHWDDSRAAANQFALARQSWTLADDHAAMCLGHFAQGLALYHAFHNEAAMMQFGRAERLMERPTVGAPGKRLAMLTKRMRPLLNVAQETLRGVLWPEEDTTGTRGQYLTVPPAGRVADDNVIYGQPPRTREAIAKEARRAFNRDPRPGNQGGVPPPISNMRGGSPGAPYAPVPGHTAMNERFSWYRVMTRRDDFLLTIPMGTWVLADNVVADHPLAGRQYVIVSSSNPSLGSITLQSFAGADGALSYLGYQVVDEASGWVQLFLDASRQPVAAAEVQVLGVVEGLWYDLQGFMMPED